MADESLSAWMRALIAYVRSGEPDLTNRQMALLMLVYLTPGPHTVRGLAQKLGVTKPVITRALDAMGKTVRHLGPVGSGALVKLINNFLAGVQAASLAEAIAIIERSTLDRMQTIGAIVNGSPGSPVMKTLAGRILADDFSPNFYLHLLVKDMGYAIAEGQSRGVPMSMASESLRCASELRLRSAS